MKQERHTLDLFFFFVVIAAFVYLVGDPLLEMKEKEGGRHRSGRSIYTLALE